MTDIHPLIASIGQVVDRLRQCRSRTIAASSKCRRFGFNQPGSSASVSDKTESGRERRPHITSDAVIEPENSTVDDWFGQDLERDREDADQALIQADGNVELAEEIFEETRRPHKADRYNVPADERPA
jgi:hypothetical protein